MRKPRISWDTEFECYVCMYADDWLKVGTGTGAKEAFVSWYIKQFTGDLIIDQKEDDLRLSAEDLWDMYL